MESCGRLSIGLPQFSLHTQTGRLSIGRRIPSCPTSEQRTRRKDPNAFFPNFLPVEAGTRSILFDAGGAGMIAPALSPDGSQVAVGGERGRQKRNMGA